MSVLTILSAADADVPIILELIHGFAEYENLPMK